MTITATGGLAAVSVTSGAEVDLLSADAAGLAIPRAFSWSLTVNTTQDITVRVYVAVGPNCGLTILTGATTSATSTSPAVIQMGEYPLQRIRVTAQAAGTTATVNCDFVAQSSSVN